MKFFLPELLAKVNDFYKAAGVLKLPAKLEADVCGWVNARYCQIMADRLNQFINSLNKREGNHQYMSDLHSKWEKLYYLIDEVKDASRYSYNKEQDLPKVMDKLIDFTSKNELNIPEFSLQKEDKGSDWLGVIVKKNTSTLFRFEKKSKNAYRFAFIARLTSDMFSKGSEENQYPKPVKADVSKFNLTIEEAASVLIAQLDKISNVCGVLESFRSNYDYADPEYIKKLKMVHILCKKYSAGAGEEATKIFSVERKDLPAASSPKFDSIARFSFHVGFGQATDRAKLYPGEKDWAGVWFAKRTPQQTGRELNIGTIYSTADIESDFKDIQASMNVVKPLAVLNETTTHELRHFIQDVIDKLAGKEDVGGLPGKDIRDPNYDLSGKKINQKIQDHPVKPGLLDESGRLEHALRDIEFYTRLSDEVNKFNQIRNKLPLALQQAFAYAWVNQITKEDLKARATAIFKLMAYRKHNVDPVKTQYDSHADRTFERWLREAESVFVNIGWHNQFFTMLEAHQPLKYQKAVKEFLKAVGF